MTVQALQPLHQLATRSTIRGMFTSSVRRVAFTAPPSPFVACIASKTSRAAAPQALSYRTHQRRCSSSKPSSPSNGSKRLPNEEGVIGKAKTQEGESASSSSSEVKAGASEKEAAPIPSQARPEGEKKAAGTVKQKSKDPTTVSASKTKDERIQTPPGMPGKGLMSPEHKDFAAKAFFSIDRPLSVSSSFPPKVTDDTFANIFKRKRVSKTSDVIATLSKTVESLESITQQDRFNPELDELRAAITAESYENAKGVQNLDQAPSDSPMMFPQHIMTGRFLPFHPPPPPVPMNTTESLAAGEEALEEKTQRRTYTAVLTIEQSTHANGDITYEAHSSPLVDQSQPIHPIRFLERMRVRREEHEERRAEDSTMHAISVKRQRKLKMKKHKYKKLMRKTRNLRRRLDRN